jgi:hypothetical protein
MGLGLRRTGHAHARWGWLSAHIERNELRKSSFFRLLCSRNTQLRSLTPNMVFIGDTKIEPEPESPVTSAGHGCKIANFPLAELSTHLVGANANQHHASFSGRGESWR